MGLGSIFFYESFVEIVHKIGGSPVELAVHRGHERGEERGHENAAKPGGEEHRNETGVSAFVVDKSFSCLSDRE